LEAKMTKKSFPNPHEIEALPGTEGWERMYPYNYFFSTKDKEREAYENNTFWFNDALHYPEPLFPLILSGMRHGFWPFHSLIPEFS